MSLQESGYEALARKYRPQTFDDVVGQEHVIAALKNSFENNRIHHAYLLTGTRGIGKTTIARIIAKCLECEGGITVNPHTQDDENCCSICNAIANGNFPDVIEIDAASQTKVDDTRVLLENTQYPPMQGRFKIYIIDEVHMLSSSSFNALLKTLEEPPAYVKFILATTDPQKIPATVLSRCLQFQLKALSVQQIASRIVEITKREGIACEKEASVVIARAARGSMRDALSLCDQAIALGNGVLSRVSAEQMLGESSDSMICNILELLKLNSQVSLEDVLNKIKDRSPNYKNLLDTLIVTLHDLALYQMLGQNSENNFLSTPEETLSTYARVFSPEALQLYYQISLQGLEELKIASDGSIAFEMTVLRLIAFTPEKKKDWIGEEDTQFVEYLNPTGDFYTDPKLLDLDSNRLPQLSESVLAELKAKALMFKEELQKASSQKTTVPVKEESVKVSETSEQLNQTIDNGSADLFAMLDDPAPIDSGKTESTQADSDTDSEITFSEEIKNSYDESVSVNDDNFDSEDKEAVSLSTSESAAPEESLNCDNTFSDSTDGVPFDVKESALTKEETVIASSENSKIIKNSFKGDDLDVLISAFEHTVKNTVTSIAKPNASKYADELKRILKKEEIVSDVIPKAVSINAGRLSENTKITVTENSALIEDVFNYLDLIKAKSDELVLKISKNSSAPVNDAKSHIEGISAVVSDINSINKELSDDAPSKSVLSAISKLPSFDENGNIVAQNPVEETTEFKLEAKEEPLSADELLLKAQEAARAQLMLDQNLNEKLLAESKEINAKTNLAELLNSDEPVKNEVAYNKDGDVLIEDNIEELKNVASSCNDAVADATVNEITDSNDTADLISSNDDVLVEPFNQLTTLQDALNIELGRKVNVSSYSVVSEGKNNYSDALIQAVNASLSGKFGSNRNVVEGVIPESKSVESAEAKTVPLEEQIKEPFEIVPEVEPEYVKDIPVLSEAQKTIVDSKTQAHSSNVSGPLLNSALTGGNNTNFPVKDGNPRALKSATLKIIEEDQQFENRRLGRKLETSDFYPKVIESSQWLKTIRNAGYTDGPMYSTLCYANRKINPNDEYDWTLEVSSDFEFLTKAPEFLHNLQTKFSILMNHPVKLSVKIVEGVPFECPEDLARKWYLKELENSRIRIRENVVLNRLLTNLGEDVNTINLTLYTQEDN